MRLTIRLPRYLCPATEAACADSPRSDNSRTVTMKLTIQKGWSSMSVKRPQAVVDAAQLAMLAEKIAAVPDKLAAVHLDLRYICNGDTSAIPAGAKQAIAEACGLLHTAIADVSEMAQHVND